MSLFRFVLRVHCTHLLAYLCRLALVGSQTCVVWFLYQEHQPLLAVLAGFVLILLVLRTLKQASLLAGCMQHTGLRWEQRKLREAQEARERASYE